MKKILAIIGSPNDEKSNTVALVRDFLDTVLEYDKNVECEVISLGKKRINPCCGCWACFKTGCCVFKNDDFMEIREKILACDFLIIGSPVYELMISAQTKILLDRTFQWIHLQGLIGKPTITAVTSGGEGIVTTQGYLSLMLQFMGCVMVGHLKGIGRQPDFFPDRALYKEKYRSLARKTVDILNGKKRLKPSLVNFFAFWKMKRHTRRCQKIGNQDGHSEYTEFEYRYWENKGWFHKGYRQVFYEESCNKDGAKSCL